MLGHKTSLNKLKKTEIISSIFSYHNTIRLEINKKKTGKHTNTWRLNNVLNNQWVNEEIKVGIKKHLEGFPGGTVVENLPANAGDTGSSPVLGRSHMPRSN